MSLLNKFYQVPPLFSFAVIADTHIMPDDDSETAPYAVLHKANQRARHVVAEVAQYHPPFVIHLGDMVRPFPALQNYHEVCDLALDIFQQLPCPVHYIPGNHDIGDKAIANAPAPTVCDSYIEKYKAKFGHTFGSFEHQGVVFIRLNSSVINSGLQEEQHQWEWLERLVPMVSGKRNFLFTHYPPYLASIDEHPHYDNIDEPGRSRLLTLMASMETEALFSGHVHHFFYNKQTRTDMYCMPSTAFTRHDFSELFAVAPGTESEFGRNDPAKLGYAIVDVYPNKHIVRIRNIEDSRNPFDPKRKISEQPTALHPRDGVTPPIAVQLRHAWNEVRSLPNNGPLDDFNRKKARNDYPLLATWRIGITWLRVPLQDLEDTQTRARMEAMVHMGQRFIVMVFGIPDENSIKLLSEHSELVSALEIIVPAQKNPGALLGLDDNWRLPLQMPIYIGTLESSADTVSTGTKYFAHTTSFGFRANRSAHIESLSNKENSIAQIFDGVVFQIPSNEDILSHISHINTLSEKINRMVMVHVMVATAQPASAQFNEQWVANRTAIACIGALALSDGIVVLDSLMDIDRGDFPRTGLVDRRGNINLAGQYLRSLLLILAVKSNSEQLDIGDVTETDTYVCVEFNQGPNAYQLYLMHSSQRALYEAIGTENKQTMQCLDLHTGVLCHDFGAATQSKALLFFKQAKDH